MTAKQIIFWSIFTIVLIVGLASWYLNKAEPSQVVCTMEAKLCPDGSYVGRSGPRCEFLACPEITPTPDTGTGSILPYNSGIRGTVMLGPTCPVERIPPDPACADRPYQTLVAVFRANDPVHAFLFAKSDEEGAFSVTLPPGEYTLGAGESNLPRCDHPRVTVEPIGFSTTTIFCDTGIR